MSLANTTPALPSQHVHHTNRAWDCDVCRRHHTDQEPVHTVETEENSVKACPTPTCMEDAFGRLRGMQVH